MVFEAVIPGGKLQAPVASRTCWASGQAVLLVDPVVPEPEVVPTIGAMQAPLAVLTQSLGTQLPPVVVVVVVVGK